MLVVTGKDKKKAKKQAVPKDVAFLADRIVLGVSVAMTALLQSSELVDNKYKSAANRAPIMLSDLRFVRMVHGEETEIEILDDGTRWVRVQRRCISSSVACHRRSRIRSNAKATS